MDVSEIMTPDPETCAPDDTIRKVASMMADGDYGSLPVLEGDRFVGVVTDRDIAVRAVAEGLGPDTPVSEVMTDEPITVEPDTDIEEVADIMAEEQIRRLYVVEDEKLVGVVSLGDLALEDDDDDDLSGDALEDISED